MMKSKLGPYGKGMISKLSQPNLNLKIYQLRGRQKKKIMGSETNEGKN